MGDPKPVSLHALKLYLFLFFASVGLTEPFLNLYLRRLGFSGAEIGTLAAIQPGVAALAPFLWTAWADATGRARALFRWNSWLAGLCFIPVLVLPSAGSLAAALTVFALLKTPLVPLANSLAFQALGPNREGYGRIRLWGSVGYILAAVTGGALVDRIGVAPVLGGVVVLLAGCGAVASGRLGRGAPDSPAPLRAGLAALLRQRAFGTFLAATFLARLSAGPYNTFFTIQLDVLGISQRVAGWAWAVGVLCEVAVMAAFPLFAARAPAVRLLFLAVLAHPVRWWLYAGVTHPVGLLAIQLFHGLTFGLFYLASVQIVDETVREDLRATGQGLYAAGVFGVAGLSGNFLAGHLFDRIGLPALYRLSAIVGFAAALLCLWVRPPPVHDPKNDDG